MEIFLFIVIVLQFGYIVFKDVQNSREREQLELKLMSKSVTEYKEAIESLVEDSPKPEPPTHLPIEDVSYDKIMKANTL
jgi:hypothetical protein